MFNKKIKIFVCLYFVVFSLALVAPVLASGEIVNPWGSDDKRTAIQEKTGLGEQDPRIIAASVINVLLGFLGIIAVVLIIYAGFLWMTAAGNEDQITKAKNLMVAAVIGLVIILAAFAIANFVLNQLVRATNTSS